MPLTARPVPEAQTLEVESETHPASWKVGAETPGWSVAFMLEQCPAPRDELLQLNDDAKAGCLCDDSPCRSVAPLSFVVA